MAEEFKLLKRAFHLVSDLILGQFGSLAQRQGGAATTAVIRWFIDRYGVNMLEAAQPDAAAYASFNEFFTRPLKAGARLVQGDTAETLRTIAQEGPDAFYRGALGQAACDWFARNGGILTREDLASTAPVEREPVRGTYRGHEVVGPPAPSAGGMHMVQMLNFLEGFDLRALGFGTAPTLHRIAEALKLDHAVVPGSLRFLGKLLTGPWDEEFLSLAPGETVTVERIFGPPATTARPGGESPAAEG